MFKNLKNGKAAGMDGIPYELYKYGGEKVMDMLWSMFGEVWREEKVPRKWNESRVILLHKGGHKSKKELKNYRPIALNDTVGKIFCMCLNERVREVVERHGVLGEEQNGFRLNRRGEDNMFIVREMIDRCNREGKKGYFAFLDIEKAYDRVDRRVLCKVLRKCGMSDKIVKIIESMYENTKAKYSLGDIETDWVSSNRGVRQGCILSPVLFALYTEELAVRMKEKGLGMKVGNEKLSLLMYADDIIIMSEKRDELQSMLDVVNEYSVDFRVKFGMDKSQIMIVNSDYVDENSTWRIGENDVKRTEEYKYLGVTLNVRGCEKAKGEKIFKANQWYGRLASVARYRANKYLVVRELWKGMAVPSIMYGMNVMNWTECELQKLEMIQNKVGRVALGANRYVGVEAVRGDMGWSTFSERSMKGNIMYKLRVERMPDERWVRKVYNDVGRESKWSKSCKRLVRKCGLSAREVNFGRERVAEWNVACLNGEGYNWDERRWKKVVVEKVQELGRNKWKSGMASKKTLEWYCLKECPTGVSYYNGSWGCELLFKARSQSLEVNARTYRWNVDKRKECKMCSTGQVESVYHVLVECKKYEKERDALMKVVSQEWGVAFFNEWNENEVRNMSRLLGIIGKVNERVIEAVKEFLKKGWSIRKQASVDMNEDGIRIPWDHTYGM